MDKAFINTLYIKHQESETYPQTSSVCKFTTKLLLILFPEQSKHRYSSEAALAEKINTLEEYLIKLLTSMKDKLPDHPEQIASSFFSSIPQIHEDLLKDIEAFIKGDPAARTAYEVVRAYPGFYAIAFYRLAHQLHLLGVPLLPRIITEYAHSKTGIDIHPGATIAPYFFIDHGTGVVIGETTIIGECVKLYQGVTLGALSVSKNMASKKRHPTIEHNVVIYAGATILGGKSIIGHDSIVGGNVWLTRSLPPHSTVYHKGQIKVQNEQSSQVIES